MKKSYYAIIPANVRYDKGLRANSKLLYGEITALCNEKGFCWASNSYFAKLYEVNKDTISKWISELADKGYIKVELIYGKGTRQIVDRYIRISHEPIDEKSDTPVDEKVKGNNTLDLNTTVNNTRDKDIVGKPDVPYKEIIEYLNERTGKNYRHTTKSHQRHIRARINEGFTLDDFKTVIDNKVNDNKKGVFDEMYLRPETLFGNKFDGYLNQNAAIKSDQYDELF